MDIQHLGCHASISQLAPHTADLAGSPSVAAQAWKRDLASLSALERDTLMARRLPARATLAELAQDALQDSRLQIDRHAFQQERAGRAGAR